MKNLRVAVVPTETGNGIDQSSSVEEILACSETQLFLLPDYFQAQNDSEIDLLHWSFLIDIEAKKNLTGLYIKEPVTDERTEKIKRIKDILAVWGATSTSELELDHSPCKNSIGNGKSNVSELIEQFDANGVSAVTYNDEQEIGWNDYNYEDLEDYLLDEIAEIMDEYEADMLKTEKRCAN